MQRILLNLLDIHRQKSVQCVLCQQVLKMQWQSKEFGSLCCKVSHLHFFPMQNLKQVVSTGQCKKVGQN